MRTFITSIFKRISQYSRELDERSLLVDKHWVVLEELHQSKTVFIFRNNSELIISRNGVVETGRWRSIGTNSMIIDRREGSRLFKHGFFDENVLALKLDDNQNDYLILVDENKFDSRLLNSIERLSHFLDSTYLRRRTIPMLLDEDLNPFRDEEGNWGYMDREGEIVIRPLYHGAKSFSEGLARVFREGIGVDHDYYGFIDEEGREVIPLRYEWAEDFNEGMALVRLNNKFGYINKEDEIVISIRFEEADSFEGNFAKVKLRGVEFMIDRQGNHQ